MNITIINSTTKKYWNVVLVPDDWTGTVDDIYQVPDGYEVVDIFSPARDATWNGTSWDVPSPEPESSMSVWEADIAATDSYMSCIEEDIIGVLTKTQYSKLLTKTKTHYVNKTTVRGNKPT